MSDTGPRLTYRTPADVRAIPNAQWERWHRDGTNPLPAFSAEASCQMALRYAMQGHARRIERG